MQVVRWVCAAVILGVVTVRYVIPMIEEPAPVDRGKTELVPECTVGGQVLLHDVGGGLAGVHVY